ncbi:hypothetical protein N7645_05310 [Pseudomonas juntendi]|nr:MULTISPECIES: hypothetical protein [Pseudomonas]MBI6914967.1 hypothetical protein [Pseudomonas juntendi]MCQ1989943.1 hypothetical protein [Pseudomonas sp. Eb3]MDH0045208.1 hypothetical protein [Pseudomonas juntendi]MDH0505775.1 hypothetical protein [Pseudomonas juntendi]
MYSFELHRRIRKFFAESEKFRAFLTVVAELAKSAEAMTSSIAQIAAGGAVQNEGAARLNAHLARVHQITSATISQRQFFKGLEHFQAALAQFQFSQPQSPELINSLKQQIEDFSDLYDVFITNGTASNALPVVLAAQELNIKLQTLMQSLQMVDDLVGNHDVAGSAEAPLTIWLPAHFDLKDFGRRLLAVQALYTELCMLLSISESDHPLRISKIESGSLWVKVFGESKVIDLLVSFVKETASWMYRNHTTEGKVSAMPLKVEAIDALLGLSTRLQAAGIDTSSMDAHIQKSAFVIAKDLGVLLDGQATITINDQTISASADFTQALGKQSDTPRLGNQDAESLPTLRSVLPD